MSDSTSRLTLSGLGIAAGWGAVAAAAAGCGGRWHWLLDLAAHFRPQYALGLVVLAALVARRHRRQAAVFATVGLLNAAVLVPCYWPRPPPDPAPQQPAIRAMSLNVSTYSGDPVRVAAAIRSADPDILVLAEVNADWLARLAPALAPLPHSRSDPRDDNFGIALYSRWPLASARLHYIGAAVVPTVQARIATPQGLLTVVGTHPVPPASAEYARWRDEQLQLLGPLLKELPAPLLLLGDLNTSPWGAAFRRLLRDSGLADSARGRGWRPTWPAYLPYLWTTLDHALHTPDIHIRSRTVGPSVGSDHYPLIVTLRLPPAPR